MTTPALDWTDKVTDIPEGGLKSRRIATAEEREALRAVLGILGCDAVEATYRIRRARGAGCYQLEGRLEARLRQACIVSLEPVHEHIKTDLDIAFEPLAVDGEGQDREADIEDPLAETDIEPIENGRIDVGRIVFEELASLLDPYPRVGGAELDRRESGGPGASTGRPDSPFAKLAALKDRKGST